MLKLYKKIDGKLQYHEAWYDDGVVTEHWGAVGERGETRDHVIPANADKDKAIREALKVSVDRGFAPIAKLAVLCIEYVVDGFGSEEDLRKRHELQTRMDETLGWTGLGHCDGGSTGSGTMEVVCLVVNFIIAKRVITADLANTKFSDFTRIYFQESE